MTCDDFSSYKEMASCIVKTTMRSVVMGASGPAPSLLYPK